MKVVIDYLKVKKPSSISIVSLVTRKSSPTPPVKMFNAFKIDNEWLVGFGMDNEKGYLRNLPAIYSL
jgi:hypoxanthine-guanine phosphoribosyltransferase